MNRCMTTAALILAAMGNLGCSDVLSPEPVQAQSSDLSVIRTLVENVLERLDSLEARETARDALLANDVKVIRGVIDTVQIVIEGEVGLRADAYGQLEGSLCAKYSLEANARFHSAIRLDARGEGTVGVDAYGNGGRARIEALAGQSIGMMPQGGAALEFQLCGRLIGEAGLEGAVGLDVEFDVTDPVLGMLDGFMEALNPSQLVSAASALNFDGARVGQTLDALSTLNVSSIPVGGADVANLVSALPLPPDLAALLQNPSSILDKAAEAGDYAIAQACGQWLRVGEFGKVIDAGCNLRNQLPDQATLIAILNALNGLPTQVATIGTTIGAACGALRTVTNGRLIIPEQTVTLPLGIGTVTTFPRLSAELFPNLQPPC